MISQFAIRSLAQKLQTTELNIQREYIQNLFLSYFYKLSESNTIYFKGGTALRIIYRSPRFSEDLDFSTSKRSISKMETMLIETAGNIEREGIKIDIKESKKTSGGYLAVAVCQLDNQEVAIQLEISQRDGIKVGDAVTVINDLTPPYTLIALSKKQLVAEKVQALLTRQKARDFYDLYFILRANLISGEDKNILKKVLGVLSPSQINYETELKQFLPKSHWAIIRNFKAMLIQEIHRSI